MSNGLHPISLGYLKEIAGKPRVHAHELPWAVQRQLDELGLIERVTGAFVRATRKGREIAECEKCEDVSREA